MESSLDSYTSSIRDNWHCSRSCASNKRSDIRQYYCNLDRMMSGGRILWNAVAICEIFKTFWTAWKSQNQWRFGESFKDMLLFAGEIWEEDILIAEIEELEKLDASEIFPRRLNAREVLKTQKMENLYFLWQIVQQIVRKRLRIPRTHSEAGIHRKEERISTENLMAIGKSFNLKKQKMTKESTRIFGLTQKLGQNFIYRHHIEPRSSTNVPREESFLIYKIYALLNETPPRSNVRCGVRIGETPKHLRQKQIQ